MGYYIKNKMQNDLSKLPAPPRGQTGVTFESLQHLPPPPSGQQGMTLDQIKGQKTDQIASENSMLQKQSNFANSSLGIAKNTIGETTQSLLGGAATFVKSAISAPVDIVRGFMGKAPSTDNTNFPTIQSQAFQKTSDVFEGTKSPLRATAEITGQTVGGAADVLGMEGLLRGGGKLVEKGIGKIDQGYQTYKAGKEIKTAVNSTGKIAEMISPKATVKEAKLAQTQGRLVQGKEPTLFRAGTEDKILPSKKTVSASETIVKNIPNAQKMSPGDLYKAVDKNITETAQKLRPQMEATPIKPETVQKINDDWSTLKKTQMADAPATEEANVLKRQGKFETILKKSGSGSHADLWDTAINYDNSIADNVKKANSLSSESLQLQKDEWLQNRKILSDAIEKTSKPEFKQMSDLYEAKNGLISKAKVNEAQMSKVNQFLKNNPKVAAVLGGATVYEVAKHLGIPLP